MIDRTDASLRCHTQYFVRTVKGDLSCDSFGIIVCGIENLGRQLIAVNWDSRISVRGFPNKINIDEPQVLPTVN